MKKILVLGFAFLFISFSSVAQTQYVSFLSNSTFKILGTSTLHDWEMVCNDFKSSYTFNNNTIENVSFKTAVKSLKSEEGDMMDNKCYDALKADEHPQITFTGTKMISFQQNSNDIKGVLEGKLNLAGKIRTIQVAFNGHINSDTIVISGKKEINMKDYDIVPPTAVWGTIKTGEKITVEFNINYKHN